MAFKVLLFSIVTILLVQLAQSQIGFASLNGGTDGGAGGLTMTVTTEAELIAAVQGNDRRIVRIAANIRASGRVRVGSNKTILGVTANAGITHGGLFIVDAQNVIVRGLILSYAVDPVDCIEIQRSSRVWIDHNEMFSDRDHGRDFYDGLLSAYATSTATKMFLFRLRSFRHQSRIRSHHSLMESFPHSLQS